MLRTAPDYLMKTIDLRGNAFWDAFDEDGETQTTFETERPTTLDCGAEQASNNSIKQNLLLFIHRFFSYKRNVINKGPFVALKPSLN